MRPRLPPPPWRLFSSFHFFVEVGIGNALFATVFGGIFPEFFVGGISTEAEHGLTNDVIAFVVDESGGAKRIFLLRAR